MYFDSFHALLVMDGHGGFVWSAYALTLLVIAFLLLAPVIRRKRLLRELRGVLRRAKGGRARVNEGETS
ncbi:MAG: heme exporter protein CcmD [Halioglobus sp.]|nr:heme exporter protein CcmD [Halioglobus sp.]